MYKVCVDNGHGYSTPGKRTPVMPDGRVIREWEFNYPTAKKLESILKSCGLSVVMSSNTRDDTSLVSRVKKANSAKADIFVSIHYNAFRGEWGTHGGVETYHYMTSTKGKRIAQIVQKELVRATGLRNRGIKTYNFYVLRRTIMPAILCECGFMDNLEEAKLMLDEAYQWKVAEAIAKGICNYFGISYVPRQEDKEKESKKDVLYKVQIGAFKDRKNAQALAERAKNAGFNVYIARDDV